MRQFSRDQARFPRPLRTSLKIFGRIARGLVRPDVSTVTKLSEQVTLDGLRELQNREPGGGPEWRVKRRSSRRASPPPLPSVRPSAPRRNPHHAGAAERGAIGSQPRLAFRPRQQLSAVVGGPASPPGIEIAGLERGGQMGVTCLLLWNLDGVRPRLDQRFAV